MNTNTNSYRYHYHYHPYAPYALEYGARNQPQRNPGQIPKSIPAAYTQQSGGEGSIARKVINFARQLAALPIPNQQQNSFERTIVDTARHVMAEVDGTSMSTPVSESTDTYTNRGSLSSSSQSLPSIAQTDAPNGDTSASGSDSERYSATVMVKFNLPSLLTDRVDMDAFYDITRQHPGDSLLRKIERLNGVTITSHLIQDHFIIQHLPTYQSKRKRRSHDIYGVEDLLSTRISLEHRISNLLDIEFKFISVTHLASFLIACGGKPRHHRTHEEEEDTNTKVKESVSMATKLHYPELDFDEATQSAYVMVTNVLHRLYPGQWVGYQPLNLQDDNKEGPSRF